MSADPEVTAGLATITTKLDVIDARMVEDREAGVRAREKIDEIHTSTRVLTERLDTHIEDDNGRFSLIWKVLALVAAGGGGSYGVLKVFAG